jgi:hypothetical protein
MPELQVLKKTGSFKKTKQEPSVVETLTKSSLSQE